MTYIRHNKYDELVAALDNPDERVLIDRVNDQGNTLLMVAAQNNNKRIVKALLRRGADANIRNTNGDTALHHCFGLSYTDLGQYLISKGGADDSVRNGRGLTPYESQFDMNP